MALNLYGNRTNLANVAAQRTVQGMGGPFSGTAAQGALKTKGQYTQGKLGEAINAWGAETIADWRNKSAQMVQQFNQDLEEMRRQAQQARATNDMEMYRLAMDRILFDKKMLAYASEIDKNNTHSLIAGLVSLAGQIGGGVLGEKIGARKEKIKSMYEPYRQIDWMEYYGGKY